jgi:hypothetical protein
MSLKLSSQGTIRTGARGIPNQISTRDRHRQLRTWLKKSEELILYDLSIVPAGVQANALADDNSLSGTRSTRFPHRTHNSSQQPGKNKLMDRI